MMRRRAFWVAASAIILAFAGTAAEGASSTLTCDEASCELLYVDFEKQDVGLYTEAACLVDFADATADYIDGLQQGRGEIVEERGNKMLRVLYPEGCIDSEECGVQLKMRLVKAADELWVSYRLRFGGADGHFDFVKGGKLPGMCGGECITGGRSPNGTNGFSERIMWRDNGLAENYLYDLDNPYEPYGDRVLWEYDGNAQGAFDVNAWHTVLTRLKLNAPDDDDGQVDSWMDGEPMVSRGGLRFRTTDKLSIDTFHFSTFFGGSDDSWRSAANCTVDFDDIAVYTTGPTLTAEASAAAGGTSTAAAAAAIAALAAAATLGWRA